MKRDVPEPWASAMQKAGMVDPRNARPSWSRLAHEVGVHTSTIIAMADGTRATDLATVHGVAQQLRVPVSTIAKWIGDSRTFGEPYEPPAESMLLSQGEKDALTNLIKQIVADKPSGLTVLGDDDVADLARPDIEQRPS